MTAKTTRIWVELTDEQMEHPYGYETYGVLAEAIKAQRPRSIAVGDRVKVAGLVGEFEVGAIRDQWVWLWKCHKPWLATELKSLTRVDDERTR